MPKIIDLTNEKFDRLTVINLDEEKSKNMKRKYWFCRCICGNIVSVASDKLRSGRTTSCGCKKWEQAENLMGKTFGWLQVVERDFQSNKDGASWKCKCINCNNPNLISVKAINLKLGKTSSCGCIQKSKGEFLIETILKDNNIKYQSQYSFSNLKGKSYPLKFDFAIFNNENKVEYLIEYQGQQHYEIVEYFGGANKFKIQQEYDEAKRQYCLNNNIKLIEIPYTDFSLLSSEYLLGLMNK